MNSSDAKQSQPAIEFTDAIGRNLRIFFPELTKNSLVIEEASLKVPVKISANWDAVGILGDTHGHIIESIDWLMAWCGKFGPSISAILQVGDIVETLYTEGEKVGASDLMEGGSPPIASSVPPIFFIEGNHDPLPFTDLELDSRFELLLSGSTTHIAMKHSDLSVGALGWGFENSKLSHGSDILLAHAFPRQSGRRFTFFGHHKNALEKSDPTRNIFGMEHPARRGKRAGSAGILYLHGDEGFFLYLPTEF